MTRYYAREMCRFIVRNDKNRKANWVIQWQHHSMIPGKHIHLHFNNDYTFICGSSNIKSNFSGLSHQHKVNSIFAFSNLTRHQLTCAIEGPELVIIAITTRNKPISHVIAIPQTIPTARQITTERANLNNIPDAELLMLVRERLLKNIEKERVKTAIHTAISNAVSTAISNAVNTTISTAADNEASGDDDSANDSVNDDSADDDDDDDDDDSADDDDDDDDDSADDDDVIDDNSAKRRKFNPQ
jgi:hypothetical protein